MTPLRSFRSYTTDRPCSKNFFIFKMLRATIMIHYVIHCRHKGGTHET